MRKLLNTLYITNDLFYLGLDGENLVCLQENVVKFRIPFDNIENIVCFSYLGCSPAVMGKCVSKCIPINFISPKGYFLAKVCGETKGNVYLRVRQIDIFREKGVDLAKNCVAAKLANTIKLLQRSLHDNKELRTDCEVLRLIAILEEGIEKVYETDEISSVLGIEGNCAKEYFSVFSKLLVNPKNEFVFVGRNKRPPLDPVNALLSFLYTLLIAQYGAALETIGLDSYIGYYHTLRSGRKSLACDMVEESRCIVERFVLTLFNLHVLKKGDFEYQPSGAVYLNDEGRKKVITRWQEKQRAEIMHPYIKQNIPLGLLPYVQSNLLGKFVRGEIEEYPCYLYKG